MGIFADLMAAIPAYTGLSPTAFFTIAALLIALYYLVSGVFAAPKHTYVPMEPLPPPVQIGEVTEEELLAYDGSDPSKPLLMAIKGQIYDVSQGSGFYGPDGLYSQFAGKDASRALAKMSFEKEDLTGNVEGLSAHEMDTLHEWEWKFTTKYVKVGQIKGSESKSRDIPVVDALNAGAETTDAKKEEDESGQPIVQDGEKLIDGPEKVNEGSEKAVAEGESVPTA